MGFSSYFVWSFTVYCLCPSHVCVCIDCVDTACCSSVLCVCIGDTNTTVCTSLSSVETSAVKLKLYHNVQNRLSSLSINLFSNLT